MFADSRILREATAADLQSFRQQALALRGDLLFGDQTARQLSTAYQDVLDR
jgi:hypothetical protein